MVLDVGAQAPSVTAANQDGKQVAVDCDDPTVVYFYPRDDTPGCTTEASQFDAELDTYREAGVDVYGVSTDDVDSHREFAADQGLEFDLLADPDGAVAAAFGVHVSNDRAERTTVVCADGEVVEVYEDVNPDGHARRVLQDMLDAGLVALEE